jgi:16S rRNA (guanine1516-N2)-methyltransferase
VDFLKGPLAGRRLTGQSRRQPIAKAVGLRGESISVVDATAGFAGDAFLLACLGCEVTAVERSPVLFALVRDALRRATLLNPPLARREAGRPSQGGDKGRSNLLESVLGRFHLVLGDSRDVLRGMKKGGETPDVVYLDPMYTPAKRRALAKKEMRICRRLVGDDQDAGELFDIALQTARRRVVVKRHPDAPPLAPDPSITFPGRTVRYDVYLLPPAPTGSGRDTSKSSSRAAS